MISVAEATASSRSPRPFGSGRIFLADALGRFLAEDIIVHVAKGGRDKNANCLLAVDHECNPEADGLNYSVFRLEFLRQQQRGCDT
jgi:hypothetical protein